MFKINDFAIRLEQDIEGGGCLHREGKWEYIDNKSHNSSCSVPYFNHQWHIAP